MNVCVYGGSSTKLDPSYIEATELLGEMLVKAGHSLVYGAGGAGLMGAVARGVKRAGGYIVGVVPRFLQVDGILYDGCDEMIFTDTMRERKQIMEDRSDAFVITPGGIGTYEEFFEIFTLKQLGQLNEPIIIYNLNGYYDGMLSMMQHTVDENFMRDASLELVTVVTTQQEVIDELAKPEEDKVDIRETKFV
ncbi:MAG: TIGR00730 family Rossman fold protein [Clostridia bacterium]|nr:TIGR00730 family Rossman fold protein [Clostridia bacterium]